MRRLERSVVLFLGIAPLWGFGAAWLADAAGWNPVVSAASIAVPVAVFGWLRRGREIIEIAAPAFAVSYAAYAGLALARLAQMDGIQPYVRLDLLDHRWPPVLAAGVAFALIFTVFVAVPASMLCRQRHVDTEGNARFWAFVREENAAHAGPKGS